MDAQLIRYLDGELSEEEAMGFLQRVEDDPDLRRLLEEEEALLCAARELAAPPASASFADQVMDALPESPLTEMRPSAVDPGRPRWRRWAPALSAAAVVLLAFALGRFSLPSSSDSGLDTALIPELTEQPVLRPDFSAIDARAGDRFRIVHLVYAPLNGSPAQVAVAGSFNGWRAGEIPMQRQGESWIATLILPTGSYEYMFIEDGTRWVTDPRAPRTRDDGFGGRNAVMDVDA